MDRARWLYFVDIFFRKPVVVVFVGQWWMWVVKRSTAEPRRLKVIRFIVA